MTHYQHPKRRTGVVQIEVVVAGIVLLALISFLPSLGHHLSRIQKESLQYQIAVQTLTNELDRLRALEPNEAVSSLPVISLPAHVSRRLPRATIQAVATHDALGLRIQLAMQWERAGNPPPVEMVGWLDPRPKSIAMEDSP